MRKPLLFVLCVALAAACSSAGATQLSSHSPHKHNAESLPIIHTVSRPTLTDISRWVAAVRAHQFKAWIDGVMRAAWIRAATRPHRVSRPVLRSRRPTVVRSSALGGGWATLRQCESGGNYANKRNPTYRGAYQFDYQTWRSVGGTGDPADAPPSEQDYRAQRLYESRGSSPWPVCGRHL